MAKTVATTKRTKASVKGERVTKKTTTSETYEYYNTDKNIKQISREQYLKTDKVIHYPIGYDGGDKYKNIKKFIFLGFGDELPIGVFKTASTGWGFTKPLRAFGAFVDDLGIEEVCIKKDGEIKLDIPGKKIYLSETSMRSLSTYFGAVSDRYKADIKGTLVSVLHKLFPATYSAPAKTYVKNALANAISSWGNGINEFSDKDKQAIKELFEKLSVETDFLSSSDLAKTKVLVDSKYIEETLTEYKRLMAITTTGDTLEKQWQKFLKDYTWVFSTIFAQPVILYKDEAFVGGKGFDNKNGKFCDFLIKNSLTSNVSLLEIKTHLTPLVDSKPYRGSDVFPGSKDLNGCMAQVLNQRDNLQKEFYILKGKAAAGDSVEAFNSKCVVLIGKSSDLTKEQNSAFELIRNNSKDVEILTFDELQAKIEGLLSLMTKS